MHAIPEDIKGQAKGHIATAAAAIRKIPHFLIIVLLAAVIYANSLDAVFQWDDSGYIKGNPVVMDAGYLSDVRRAEGLVLEGNIANSLRTRRLVYLSFALNYALHGFDVRGYHAVNLAIHMANALLLYMLVVLTLKTPFLKGSPIAAHSRPIALLTSLLFLCHPVQTEAVTYITQRFTSMAAMFCLASAVSYAAFRLSGNRARGYALYALSILCAALAMNSKEVAFTLPVAIGLYEFSFFEGGRKKRALMLVPIVLTMMIVPLGLILRGGAGSFAQALDYATRTEDQISRHNYLITQFAVIVTYLRLLLLPINQNLDYDYPLYQSFLEPKVAASFALLALMCGLALYLYRRSRRGEPGLRLVGFGVLWFFLALSVESSIIPLSDLIFEHRLYLPSAGVFLAAVSAMALASMRMNRGRVFAAAAVVAIMALSAATVARNRVWVTELSMWEDAVQKSPEKARPHNNLGVVYGMLKRYDDAEREFVKALEIYPGIVVAHFGLGTVYENRGQLGEAEQHYLKALEMNPSYVEAHAALGFLYDKMGRYAEAEKSFQTALSINSDMVEVMGGLGGIYRKQGRYADAERRFLDALALNPRSSKALYNLGMMYEELGRYEEAEREFLSALGADGYKAAAHYNLALFYEGRGRHDEAELQYRRALEEDAYYISAYNNLGAMYFNLGRYDEAAEQFRAGLRIQPQNPQLSLNLATVLAAISRGGS